MSGVPPGPSEEESGNASPPGSTAVDPTRSDPTSPQVAGVSAVSFVGAVLVELSDGWPQGASAWALLLVGAAALGLVAGGAVLPGIRWLLDHREAATELVRFLTNAPSQRALFVDGGFAATRRSVYDDPGVQAAVDYAGELRSAVDNAEPRPEGPCYARFSKILRDAVTAALRGDGSLPDDLVEQLDAALNCRPAP